MKQLVRLRNRRERDATRTFLVEGFRELTRAASATIDVDVVDVYFCPSLFLGDGEQRLLDRLEARGATLVELGDDAFRKIAYRDRPEGLLAVVRQFDTRLERLEFAAESLVLVVEAIEKPGNLGTMLRTADAAGVGAVIVCDPTTDPFNPNAVRASVGSLFTVPIAVTSTTTARERLHAEGMATVATTPDATDLHWQAAYTGSVAIVVGSEQHGLSDRWLDSATRRVRIPMAGAADSLNAAMAAGIVLFEAVRQRSSA